MWVDNPDTIVGFLEGTTPDAVYGNVKAGSCLGVCSASCQYLDGQRLKFSLNAHTSVRRVAVKFLILLCLIDGKPTLVQVRVCSTERVEPQSHLAGSLSVVQPYRSHIVQCKTML